MIPKIVHYCWFGGKEKTRLAKKCIKSWKKHLIGYEFKEWNESNFDIHCNSYVEEAYNSKRFAFVADYARLHALYKEGGIYMDTDVEVLKPLDEFLVHIAFAGYESNSEISTGILGAEKGNLWIGKQLEHYNGIHFVHPDGSLDLTTNVEVITAFMVELGLRQDNTFQEFNNLVTIYPNDFFSPKDYWEGDINLTENSYAIHHFATSWKPKSERTIRERLYPPFINIIRFLGLKNSYRKLRNFMKS